MDRLSTVHLVYYWKKRSLPVMDYYYDCWLGGKKKR